ncbi:MAG: purK [Candidatus Taylorbacteria bacterium]|nr:purK [Candidatus Taylorbacteria bacterium]
MKTLPVGSTIGIVGGGQLGRMTRAAASELGFKTLILSNNKDGCAFNDGSRHIIAPYDDDGALETFVRQCSVITIEFESLPPSIFDAVHEIGQGKVPMYPSRIALETSQNRRREKMMA